MSKVLYIVRHAKSSWADEGMADFERPLKESGVQRTNKIGKFLKDKDVQVDLILSSHAVRAYETSKIIADQIAYPIDKIQIEENIYFTSLETILNILFGQDDQLNAIMIFGHNPTFTNLANYFLDQPINYLPTTGIVAIEFDTSKWNEILSSVRKTRFVVFPKMLA